jgi:2-isopropylmalate synthase
VPDQVKIYDTTLRDGCQGAGISLSLQDKLDIARRLDDFGADYVEGRRERLPTRDAAPV